MSDEAIILTILAVSVVVFVWNRLPVGIVALGVALSLWATDVITLEEAFAGFSNPTVILIAALFVVAEALDAAGVTTWVGQMVVRHAGGSRGRLLLLVMGAVAILTALITPNGSVAALYPMVVVLAVRLGDAPSKLLMPVAFAAHAGALLILTGSPVSLLVSEAADEAGVGRIGFFEIALVGVPLLIGTMAVVILFGGRLLPARTPRSFSRDLSKLPSTLKGQYLPGHELALFLVGRESPFLGLPADQIGDPDHPEVHVISVKDGRGVPMSHERVDAATRVVLRGSRDDIRAFAADHGLIRPKEAGTSPLESGLVNREFGVAEVIVAPRSDYIGDHVFPGMVTDSGNLVVLGVQRYGEDVGVEETTLKAGDSLLLQGRWDALDEHTVDPNVVLIDTPDAIRRQAVPLGPRALPALAVLAVMIVLLGTGVVPPAIACLLAAIAMVLLRVVTVNQAHRSMSWTTIILVAAMIPLSNAITESGAAESIASGLIDAIGDGGPYVIMTGIFLITALLGQMISNTATALILIPITVSIAAEGGYSPMTMLMCLNVAAAAALLTPIATPANLMVMEPAGYKFGDYWKLGLPVMGVYYVVAVLLVPLIWPLS
jgi:di/tricarboxylate transporter